MPALSPEQFAHMPETWKRELDRPDVTAAQLNQTAQHLLDSPGRTAAEISTPRRPPGPPIAELTALAQGPAPISPMSQFLNVAPDDPNLAQLAPIGPNVPPRNPKTLAMQAHVADLEAVRNRLRDIGRPTSTEMMLAPPGVPYHGSVTHGNLPANPDVPAHLMAAATMSPGYSSARPLPGSMNSSVPSGLMDQAYSAPGTAARATSRDAEPTRLSCRRCFAQGPAHHGEERSCQSLGTVGGR